MWEWFGASTIYSVGKDFFKFFFNKQTSNQLRCSRIKSKDNDVNLSQIITQHIQKFSCIKTDSVKNIGEIVNTIEYVFSNHTFNKDAINIMNSKDMKQYKKKYNMTTDFHKNEKYYVDAHDFIQQMNFSEKTYINNLDKNVKPSDFLADSILSSFSHLTRNPLFLVQGSIGSGKSTLLSRTYLKLLDKREELTLKPIVVFIDFQESFSSQLYKEEDVEEAFKKLISNLKSEITKQSENVFNIQTNRIKNLPIIILLDNLDELYEHFCKISFFDYFGDEGGYEALKRYYPLLFRYIEYFHNNGGNKLYAGPIANVLCCRDDTTKLIKAFSPAVRGDLENNIDLDFVIQIIDPEDNKANKKDSNNPIGRGSYYTKEILISRMIMLSEYFRRLDYNECSATIEKNIELLKSSSIDYHEMNVISVQGLRHTVYLFSTAAFACLDNNLFKRFFLQKDILRKLHFIGKKTKYSQVNDGIANIFLLNRGYRLETLKPKSNGPKHEQDIYNEIKNANHIHTFWLKYLILESIHSGNVSTKNDLISIFTANGSEEGYNKTAVELCLLSLAQVEHGRLIIPDVINYSNNGEPNNVSIKETTRAKHLLDKNIFFSYDYLSTIIEDEWLTYIQPDNDIEGSAEYKKIIESLKNFSNDYLFEIDHNIFNKKAKEANIKKIPFVSLFLYMLEESLSAEEKIKTDVFRHLKTQGIDISTIRKKLSNAKISIAKDIIEIENFLNIKNKALSILWDINQHPRSDNKDHKSIVLARRAVKKLYKRHAINPIIDKR